MSSDGRPPPRDDEPASAVAPDGGEGTPPPALRAKLSRLPDAPGVYLHKDQRGKVIYVGKAKRLSARVRSYFQAGGERDARLAALARRIRDFDTIVTRSEIEALVLENQLIKEYRPEFNVRLRDDKQYPYLKVTVGEPLPRVLVVRRILPDGARYFGPYTDARAMRETLKFAAGIFRVRTCHLDLPEQTVPRPCLDHQIGRCSAPCVGLDDPASYGRKVRQLVLFLEGGDRKLLADLRAEMTRLARRQRFEAAAAVRDRLLKLEKTLAHAIPVTGLRRDVDACGVARDGAEAAGVVLRARGGRVLTIHHFALHDRLEREPLEHLAHLLREYYGRAGDVPAVVLLPEALPDQATWEQWLGQRRGRPVRLEVPRRGPRRAMVEMARVNAGVKLNEQLALGALRDGRAKRAEPAALQLQEALGLRSVPETIACFDLSNFQGREAVGSLVAFRDGEPWKSGYRRFRIRTVQRGDDYAMMREVLMRYCARLVEREEPPADLVMVDGGAGQLGVAREVLAAHGFHLTDVIGLAKAEELIHRESAPSPLALPASSRALQLLRRVRDEAHRFAITYHRLLRDRRTRASVLDEVPGIGEVKKLALLHHFGSAAAVRTASAAELSAVRGINRHDVERIMAYFASRPESEP